MTRELTEFFKAIEPSLVAIAILVANQLLNILRAYVEKWRAHWHPPLKETNARDLEINKMLREIRFEFKADRAYIGRFSNGVQYINRDDIVKYSWAYEDVEAGMAQVADQFQDIKISLVPEEFALADEPGPGFRAIEDLQNGRLKNLSLNRGVRSIARCCIGDPKIPIGFIGLDYTQTSTPPANIDALVQYAGRLQEMLRPV